MLQKFITHRTKLFITTSILPIHCYELWITNISFVNLNCIYWEENEYNKVCCEVFSSFLKNRYGSRQRQKQQTTGRVLHAENFLGLIFLVVFLSLVEASSVMCPFISQALQAGHLRIIPQFTKEIIKNKSHTLCIWVQWRAIIQHLFLPLVNISIYWSSR